MHLRRHHCVGLFLAFYFVTTYRIFFSWNANLIMMVVRSFVERPTQLGEKQNKLILAWTKREGEELGQIWTHKCPGCVISSNRTQIKSAAAVIFSWGDWGNDRWSKLPKIRYPWQYYVFINMESPYHTMGDLNGIRNFFNLTMSYMRNSDVYSPYGAFVQSAQAARSTAIDEIIGRKTKIAAWMVSNCRTPSRREEIATKLQKHMQVDIFGDCGNKQNCSKAVRTGCDKMLESNYFFYLSFENSNCPDYITEKLFERLSVVIVPIVLVRKSYEQIAPAKSFVAVDDFNSIEQLADYLKYLSTNHTAYREHLEWRNSLTAVTFPPYQGICNLCQMLHNSSLPANSYSDLNRWLRKDMCTNGPLEKYFI